MARLNLLVGESGHSGFSEAVRILVRDTLAGPVGDFHIIWCANDIVQLTGHLRIDCHVLLMNNLWYDGRGRTGFDLTGASLRFMSDLRAATDAPILAFYGFADDADYPHRLYSAGADFVARTPFDSNAFQEAVRRLLASHPDLPRLGRFLQMRDYDTN
jgi:hypothetical protein